MAEDPGLTSWRRRLTSPGAPSTTPVLGLTSARKPSVVRDTRCVPPAGLRRVRWFLAWGLVWLGRVLLVAAPVIGVFCFQLRDEWRLAPVDADGFSTHWLPNLTTVAAFVWSLFLPALLLPVGSDALATETESEIKVVTVLGGRRVRLPVRRVRRLHLPGRGWGLDLAVVTGSNRRTRVLATSEAWGTDAVAGRLLRRSPRRARQSVAGWIALLVWALLAFFVGSVFADLSGAL